MLAHSPAIVGRVVERRNWVYGGRRRFWDLTLAFVGLFVPLRLSLVVLSGAPGAVVAVTAAYSMGAVGFVAWRWRLSRCVHDGDAYASLLPFWRRLLSRDGGASHPNPGGVQARPWGVGTFIWIYLASSFVAVFFLPHLGDPEGSQYLDPVASAAGVFTNAGFVVFAWLAFLRRGGLLRVFGLHRPRLNDWKWAGIALASTLAASFVFTFLVDASGGTVELNVPDAPPATITAAVMFFLVAVIAAPIGEEILFRGLLLGGIIQTVGRRARRVPVTIVHGIALAVSAVVFGLAHWGTGGDPLQVVAVTGIFGLILGVVAIRTSSLTPVVIAHAANNLGAFVLMWVG